MNHLTEEQLFSLVDRGIAPNQEDTLTAHVVGCAECRRSLEDLRELVGDLAPEATNDEEAHVRRVMATVAARGTTPRRGATARGPRDARARTWLAAATTVVALAAGVLLFVGSRHRETGEGDFAARGDEQKPALARNVGVRLLAGEHRPAPLGDGAIVAPNAAFTASYTNLHPKPVHVLVFAVDAANVVHWLYPAYTRLGEDPASVLLERSSSERFMPTSVVLDAPAEGRLRIVSLATETPLHVSDIEKRKAPALEGATLERDFRGAVTELSIEVRSSR